MADRNAEIKARLLATFRVEAQEHLQAIRAHLLILEHGLPSAEAQQVMEATFREVHTLKGAARSVSLLDIEALCQALESVLSRITRRHLTMSQPILHRVRAVVDGVAHLLAGNELPTAAREALLNQLAQAASTAEDGAQDTGTREQKPEADFHPSLPDFRPLTSAPQSATALPLLDTVRLPTARLDALLHQAEDLLGPKLAAAERVRDAQALFEALQGSKGLEAQARELFQHLVRDQRSLTTVVGGLQEALRRLRMMPASAILDLFPPMVQDLANTQGKEVEWEAWGADLEVDRKVLEAVKDPLIHLVRNAIDHGIEPPA
ncbi:MAG TPA: Hpt domain-containing protein, partial [Candidatus Tectomicrobia bacterium]